MRNQIVKDILKRTPKSTHIFVRKCADITIRVNQLIVQKKPYLDIKEGSELKKWIEGEHNFSLEDIAKLEDELGAVILEVPKIAKMSRGTTMVFSKRYPSKENHIKKNSMISHRTRWESVNQANQTLVI